MRIECTSVTLYVLPRNDGFIRNNTIWQVMFISATYFMMENDKVLYLI